MPPLDTQIKTNQDLQLGPSWVLVLLIALEITVEERPLAFDCCLDIGFVTLAVGAQLTVKATKLNSNLFPILLVALFRVTTYLIIFPETGSLMVNLFTFKKTRFSFSNLIAMLFFGLHLHKP